MNITNIIKRECSKYINESTALSRTDYAEYLVIRHICIIVAVLILWLIIQVNSLSAIDLNPIVAMLGGFFITYAAISYIIEILVAHRRISDMGWPTWLLVFYILPSYPIAIIVLLLVPSNYNREKCDIRKS